VITMEMLGKVKRMYFRDKKSLHEIAKRTGLSRNTIRKWVRDGEGGAEYRRKEMPGKLTPFTKRWSWRSKPIAAHQANRRTAKALLARSRPRLHGGYSRSPTSSVSGAAPRQGTRKAFVPLTFALGEAFQFDWSDRRLGGGRHLLQRCRSPSEAVRQPGVLAGGLPQPGP
jgi:transposase-like protein